MILLRLQILAKYVLYSEIRNKNDYNLNVFNKSCLQKVLAYNPKSVPFCILDFAVEQLLFLGLLQRKLLTALVNECKKWWISNEIGQLLWGL